MLEQRGRIVSIDRDDVWVETAQRQVCHGCAARSGCGTGLLGDHWAATAKVRVTTNGQDPGSLSIDTPVVIGIAEGTVAGGALMVYLLPLVALLGAAILGNFFAGEAGAVLGAAVGLFAGALTVRALSRRHAAIAPQLLRIDTAAQAAKQPPQHN